MPVQWDLVQSYFRFKKEKKCVIYYASRSLSDVEKRYSQTEKEALALVWACERFHQCVYSINFILETDHRPLQVIDEKKSKPSARIERWVQRLQSYNFHVEYRPGKQNIADSLSLLVNKKSSGKREGDRNVAEEYIYFAAVESVPKAMSPREIEEASAADEELMGVQKCIKTNNVDDCPNTAYKTLRNELTVLRKLVLQGTRIVIPNSLRQHG